MSNSIFPALPGLSITSHKRANWSTKMARAASGKIVQMPRYVNPVWEFELTHEGLSSSGSPAIYQGLAARSLQSLVGFYNVIKQAGDTFLYQDPDDNSVSNQVIQTGDGVSTVFTAVRAFGAGVEAVGYVDPATLQLFLNGTLQTSGYTLSGNLITFGGAPASGVSITASFAYYFRCWFSKDHLDIERLWTNTHMVDSLIFESVLQ